MEPNTEQQQDDPEFIKAFGILQPFMAKHIAIALGTGETTVSFRLHYVPGYTLWWFGDGGSYIICPEWWYLNQAHPNAEKDTRRTFSDAVARKAMEHFERTLGFTSRLLDFAGVLKFWFLDVTFQLIRKDEASTDMAVKKGFFA
jgi:hypothetical protein